MPKLIPCRSVPMATWTAFCLYSILSFVAPYPVAANEAIKEIASEAANEIAEESLDEPVLLHAARVFDGNSMRTNTSVLVINGKVAEIDTRDSFKASPARTIDLGDATILPGFIELHAHLAYQHIPAETVLKHGITTIRDVGGPVHLPYGGGRNFACSHVRADYYGTRWISHPPDGRNKYRQGGFDRAGSPRYRSRPDQWRRRCDQGCAGARWRSRGALVVQSPPWYARPWW